MELSKYGCDLHITPSFSSKTVGFNGLVGHNVLQDRKYGRNALWFAREVCSATEQVRVLESYGGEVHRCRNQWQETRPKWVQIRQSQLMPFLQQSLDEAEEHMDDSDESAQAVHCHLLICRIREPTSFLIQVCFSTEQSTRSGDRFCESRAQP